jgi:UDP-3-O-acyl N-acetylglucosamine deacetylase
MSPRILIVDDEPGIQTALAGIFHDEGFETMVTGSGAEAVDLYRQHRPDVVFLDIWLPDRDGLETLGALRSEDPQATVIMMSGHGTAATAVKAIKMGAADYLEKPLSYRRAVDAVTGALGEKHARRGTGPEALEVAREQPLARTLIPPPRLPLVRAGSRPQRTLTRATVLYGLGLHSGSRTGMALQPLPPGTGIHFLTLPAGTLIAAHVSSVAETDYATTLSAEGEAIRTVEHLLSALHAHGVTNLLIKVHGEIPVLDGSALEFCKTLEEVGLVDQPEPAQELEIDRVYEVGGGDGPGAKSLRVEPYDGFRVSYLLRYPEPVGEQSYEFELDSPATYQREIAPARTFGFVRDLKMMSELGLGSGGRLDNFILVGDEGVVNTELRFPDEFVRHKILDIIGDLYLAGFPLRGKVTARLTGHRDNIALLRKIFRDNGAEV